MICPICGTQQRPSTQCVQCHTPISPVKKTGEEESELLGIEPSLEESFRQITPSPDEKGKESGPGISQELPPSHASYPASLPVENPLLPPPPVSPLDETIKENSVLISTTQRVEGKRIRRYFGLIHATVIVSLSHKWASSKQGEYRLRFDEGTTNILNGLKKEAAVIGANAVVATILDTHPIDSESVLLSAIGTAVFLEGPKQ